MINSEQIRGQLHSDFNSIKSALNDYSSSISNLNGSWKGMSFEKLCSNAESFVSEYGGALESQMNAFEDACSAYSDYLTLKGNKKILEDNIAEATRVISEGNTGEQANLDKFNSDLNQCETDINKLKELIISSLETAKTPKLSASPQNYSVVVPTVNNSNEKVSPTGNSGQMVNNAMDWAVGIANDDSHGYSQETRFGNPNYDCSSLVISSWDAAGVPVIDAGATYTGDMREAFLSTGQFEWIPGDPNMEDLQPGDVLLTEGVHTEMYLGDGQNVGALNNYDGCDGDSSGDEISVMDYSHWQQPWQGVLRYIGDQ